MKQCAYAFIAAFTLSTLTILNTSTLLALPGDLDPNFGTNGVATVDLGTDNEELNRILVLEDGKILGVGVRRPGGLVQGFIVRLNMDGSLDESFNGQGYQVVSDDGGAALIQLVALGVQSDGKILAAGTYVAGSEDILVVRLNADGSFDDSFGTEGWVRTPVSPSTDSASGLAIQADGKIVIGGFAGGRFMALRYLPDGSLDPDFGSSGVSIQNYDGEIDFGRDVALQSDGKIILVGQARSGGVTGFGIVRLNQDGSLDESFGQLGWVYGPFSNGEDNPVRVKIQPDDSIVTGGLFNNGVVGNFGIARYLSGGSLDDSFGTNGLTLTPFGALEAQINDLVLQDDGFIVATGKGNQQVALARYTPAGILDDTFGLNGTLLTDLGFGQSEGVGLALQNDGKIVVSAQSLGNAEDLRLIRYLGNTANLTLSKTSNQDSVGLGGSIGFTLTINNEGPNDAGGTMVLDTLPLGLALDPNSFSTSQGDCSALGQELFCDLGTLTQGSTVTINYLAVSQTMGTFTNMASVTAQAINENPDAAMAAFIVTVTEAGGGCGLNSSLNHPPSTRGFITLLIFGLVLGLGMRLYSPSI